ncbi:MAG: chemotaxis protein CheW [Candidatus Methylacidiphilales bacterium]|nr:chemotaxis protein CheW [Candidatus Methylacidiphilales bacterium]
MNLPGPVPVLYLLLTAGGVHYAMRATGIRRLVPYVRLHAPPSHAPAEFVGWLNWQGELIPVVDGTMRLAGRPTVATLISRILLVENEEMPSDARNTIGIIAECAHKTARLLPQDFKLGIGAAYSAVAASSASAHASYSMGAGGRGGEVEIPLLPVMEYEGELLHLLELKHLMTPELSQAFVSPTLQGLGAGVQDSRLRIPKREVLA